MIVGKYLLEVENLDDTWDNGINERGDNYIDESFETLMRVGLY